MRSKQSESDTATGLVRLNTGVPGLNNILSGGLPAGQMYLLEGDPGTGKTTLAMQFIMAGTQRGEKALYITLSEPTSELHASARSHGGISRRFRLWSSFRRRPHSARTSSTRSFIPARWSWRRRWRSCWP